jgi:hypothetical protein
VNSAARVFVSAHGCPIPDACQRAALRIAVAAHVEPQQQRGVDSGSSGNFQGVVGQFNIRCRSEREAWAISAMRMRGAGWKLCS